MGRGVYRIRYVKIKYTKGTDNIWVDILSRKTEFIKYKKQSY